MKNIPTFESFVNESVLNEGKMVINPLMDKTVSTPWGKPGMPRTTVILGKTSTGLAVTINGDFVDAKAKKYVLRPSKLEKEEAYEMIKFHENRLTGGYNKEWLGKLLAGWNTNESELNEDATTAILMLQAAMVGGQIALLANKVDFHPIDDLKDWWREHKRDKAVQSIIDKLKDDQDVIEFLQLPKSKQEGQWKKLISPKLTADELKYINSISRNRVKTGKI